MASFQAIDSKTGRAGMRVLYIASPFKLLGGGGTRSYEILRRVSKHMITPIIVLHRNDIREYCTEELTTSFGTRSIYAIDRLSECKLTRIGRSLTYLPMTYSSISRDARIISKIAQREGVDLIVAHHEVPHYILEAYYASKMSRLPWTCVIQAPFVPLGKSTYWRKTNPFRSFCLSLLYRPLHELALKALNHTVPLLCSPSIKFDMEIYASGWRGNAHILNPGVGINHSSIIQAVRSEEVSAIYFSRLMPSKGIYDIAEVWREIVSKDPKSKLVVAGRFISSSVRNKFFRIIGKYRLQRNVIYKGYLQSETLFSLVKSAKVFVYPSRFDAISLAVLESLACGTPVVAYDIMAMRLNYQGTKAVKVVAVGDFKSMAEEARKIIEDETLRRTLSEDGKSFASSFSWDKAVREEVNAYSEILNPTPDSHLPTGKP